MLKIRYSSSQWSVFLVIGLILIILGLVAISLPQLTAIAMFSVIGWVLLLSGFFQLFQLIGSDVSSWEYLIAPIFLAIFYGLVGMFVLMFPQATVQLLSTVLSLFFFKCLIRVLQQSQVADKICSHLRLDLTLMNLYLMMVTLKMQKK